MIGFYRRIKSSFIFSILLALLICSALTVRPISAATRTVENTNDSGAGSLRQAIIDVTPGGTITFDPSLSGGTITLTSTTLMIEKSLTVDGSSLPDHITISGSNNMNVFYVAELVTVTLDSLIITDGKAKYGSGIDNRGTLTVNNSTIHGNGALYEGGGIRNLGTLVVTNSTLFGNTASNELGFPSSGGGIFNEGSITVTNSTLSGNSSKDIGGGIYNIIGTLIVTNSTISHNTAFHGGGISNYAILDMINSTLSENSAGCSGGGIYNQGTLNYSNTIIANSISGMDCYNNGGTIGLANTKNIVVINALPPNDCGTPYLTADPMLGPLADNGGPTLTHALQFGSPAIDAGDHGVCPPTDQRGVSRPVGSGCDIGAFEYVFVIFLPMLRR